MLANNWSPPPLCLLALEATEPAEEAIKTSITNYKLNNNLGHTNLIICFSDWVEKKRDPVGRQKKKKKKKGEYH